MRYGVGPSYLVTIYRRRVPKMTKRMISAVAGLGLMAATITGCSTLAGAGPGARAGAAGGAGTGYGAGKGAFIGTRVWAQAGALYGATEKERGRGRSPR